MRSKTLSKFDLLLAVATIAALLGWIEHGHSIIIDPPDQIALSAAPDLPPVETSCREQLLINAVAFPEDAWLSGLIGRPAELKPSACEPN